MIAAVAISAAAWIVLSAVGATGYSAIAARVKRRASEFTDWSLWMPEVPSWDETALDVWPTAEEAEQAIFDRLFAAIPEVAADLRAQS